MMRLVSRIHVAAKFDRLFRAERNAGTFAILGCKRPQHYRRGRESLLVQRIELFIHARKECWIDSQLSGFQCEGNLSLFVLAARPPLRPCGL